MFKCVEVSCSFLMTNDVMLEWPHENDHLWEFRKNVHFSFLPYNISVITSRKENKVRQFVISLCYKPCLVKQLVQECLVLKFGDHNPP